MMRDENEHLHDVHERLLRMAAAGESDLSHAFAGANEDDAAPPPALPELEGAFGTYELERSLGHGGQGVVYLANDTRLGRKVALKLLSASGAAGATARARFEREATAASRLHHAGICTVYEAGELDGQRFLAMEYVDGESLPQWIARTTNSDAATDSGSRRTRVDAALHLVEQIARAVHAAHEAGVIHRDLKPQNIMLRRDGSPVVLDFGLARDDRDDGEVLTMQGDVLGTPAYMPPERVRGTAGKAADAREDVYGVGAILYECLTGQRPFRGHTREQLYQRILTSQVEDPRNADPAIPREARYVIETAMEKAPDRRYASALELADELQRLQQREPILARPVPRWLRLQRWVQRHPGAAIPTIAAFVVLVAGVVTALSLLASVDVEARHARIRALVAASALEVERDPQRALLLGREANRQLDSSATDELRTAVRSQLIEVLARSRRVGDFEFDGTRIGVGFSSDGRRLVAVGRGDDGACSLRSWQVNGEAHPIDYHVPPGRRRHVTSCAFDVVQNRVLLASWNGVTRVVSPSTGELLHELAPPTPRAPLHCANINRGYHLSLTCFVPRSEDLVLTGSRDGARLWQLRPGQLQGREVWHDLRPEWQDNLGVGQIVVSSDGTLCAAGEHDGTVRVLKVESGELIGQGQQHTHNACALGFDPNRPLLVSSADTETRALVWNTEAAESSTGIPSELRLVGELGVDGRTPILVQFAPTTRERPSVLLVTDSDRALHLFRGIDTAPYFERYAVVRAHAGVLTAAFSPDGSRLMTGSHDGMVRIFDLEGRLIEEIRGSDGPVPAVAWSPNGELIGSSEHYGPGRLWRAIDKTFRVERVPRAVAALAGSGQRIAAGLRDGSIAIADLSKRGTTLASRPSSGVVEHGMVTISMRRDGKRLAVGARPNHLDLWDLSSGKPRLEPPIEAANATLGGSNYLDFGDGGELFVGTRSKVVAVHANRDIETVAKVKWASIAVTARSVAVVGTDIAGTDIAMWDCQNGVFDSDRVLNFDAQETDRPYMTTSYNRRWIALLKWNQGIDGRIRIIDAEQRRVHRELHVPQTRSVALSANGDRLLTTGLNGQVKLWDLEPEAPRLIAELRGHRSIVWGAYFSPDGRQLVTAGSDGTIRFWPAQFDGLEDLLKERLVREFTALEEETYGDLLDH